MKILIIGLIILFSHIRDLQAQLNCQKDPSARISLRDTSGPLANYPVQDQDGLGTCYANTLATLLYAKTGKDISAQQVAAIYGRHMQSGEFRAKLDDGIVGEGGSSCAAFEAIQNRPYLCSRSSVPAEKILHGTNTAQRDYHYTLAELYDHSNNLRNENKKDRIDLSEKLRQAYAAVVARRKTSQDYRSCLDSFEEHLKEWESDRLAIFLEDTCIEMYDQLSSLVEEKNRLIKSANGNDSSAIREIEQESEFLRKRIRSLGYVHYVDRPDENTFKRIDDLDLTVIEAPKDAMLACDVYDLDLKSFTDELYAEFNTKGYMQAQDLLYTAGDAGKRNDGDILNALRSWTRQLKTIPGDESWPHELFFSDSPFDDKRKYEHLFADDIMAVLPAECDQLLFISPVDLRRELGDNRPMCSVNNDFLTSTSNLMNQMTLSTNSGYPINGDLGKILSLVDYQYDDYLMGLIGEGCYRSEKNRIPKQEYEGYTCKSVSLRDVDERLMKDLWLSANRMQKDAILGMIVDSGALTEEIAQEYGLEGLYSEEGDKSFVLKNLSNSSVSAVLREIIETTREGKDLMKARIGEKMNLTVHKNLQNGNPVSASVCGSVMYDSAYDSDLGECLDGGQHNNHAVVFIGQRCSSEGEVEYLIQNSWGQGCPAGNDYDCNFNEGTMWIPQSTLIPNTLRLDSLTP